MLAYPHEFLGAKASGNELAGEIWGEGGNLLLPEEEYLLVLEDLFSSSSPRRRICQCYHNQRFFRDRMASLVWDLSFCIICLGNFAWDLAFGNFCV